MVSKWNRNVPIATVKRTYDKYCVKNPNVVHRNGIRICRAGSKMTHNPTNSNVANRAYRRTTFIWEERTCVIDSCEVSKKN